MVEKLRGAESYRGASVLSWIQFLLIRNGRCDVRSKSPLAVPWKTCKWLMRVSFHVVSQEVLFMLFAASASVGIFVHPHVQRDTHCKSTYMSVSSSSVLLTRLASINFCTNILLPHSREYATSQFTTRQLTPLTPTTDGAHGVSPNFHSNIGVTSNQHHTPSYTLCK